jgi:hypothetical protein
MSLPAQVVISDATKLLLSTLMMEYTWIDTGKNGPRVLANAATFSNDTFDSSLARIRADIVNAGLARSTKSKQKSFGQKRENVFLVDTIRDFFKRIKTMSSLEKVDTANDQSLSQMTLLWSPVNVTMAKLYRVFDGTATHTQ